MSFVCKVKPIADRFTLVSIGVAEVAENLMT